MRTAETVEGDQGASWQAYGFSDEMAEAWAALGFSPFEAALARGDGFAPGFAGHYRRQLQKTAAAWLVTGLPADECLRLHRSGSTPAEVTR